MWQLPIEELFNLETTYSALKNGCRSDLASKWIIHGNRSSFWSNQSEIFTDWTISMIHANRSIHFQMNDTYNLNCYYYMSSFFKMTNSSTNLHIYWLPLIYIKEITLRNWLVKWSRFQNSVFWPKITYQSPFTVHTMGQLHKLTSTSVFGLLVLIEFFWVVIIVIITHVVIVIIAIL